MVSDYKRQFLPRKTKDIRDVVDSKLYQEVFDGSHFRGTPQKVRESEVHISFQFNTDGVSLFRSKCFSVWPLFLTINEVPPSLR